MRNRARLHQMLERFDPYIQVSTGTTANSGYSEQKVAEVGETVASVLRHIAAQSGMPAHLPPAATNPPPPSSATDTGHCAATTTAADEEVHVARTSLRYLIAAVAA